MRTQGDLYYELGLDLFEANQYDLALEYLIAAYDVGAHQEEIIEGLYASFIEPNDKEFRDNYATNICDTHTPAYENLRLDFVPISDSQYFIFDKESKVFCGFLDLEELAHNISYDESGSILIAQQWDVRKWIRYISGNSQIYFLIEGMEELFYSFYKLPDFKLLFLKHATIFSSEKILTTYFMKHDELFLPRKIAAQDTDYFRKLVSDIHQYRITTDRSSRVKPILSVCIPSYNRGNRALNAVKKILDSEFDSEIQVVISDNGSLENNEGYSEIAALKDSRVCYHRFPENQGYLENVFKVLSLAKGRFAVLSSDDDVMVVESLSMMLEYLMEHPDLGVCLASGIGDNFAPVEKVEFHSKFEEYFAALNCNYITGLVLNTAFMHEEHVEEIIRKYLDNTFVQIYIHICIATLLVKNHPIACPGIVLWTSLENEAIESYEPKRDSMGMLSYMTLESRIEQLNAAIAFEADVLQPDAEMFHNMLQERIEKTYHLLWIIYYTRKDIYHEMMPWYDVCITLYKNNINLVNQFYTGGTEYWNTVFLRIMFSWLNKHPLDRYMTMQQKLLYETVNKMADYWVESGRDILEFDFERASEYIQNYD